MIDGKDRKESLFAIYNIIRERPEDENSKVLRFEKWKDSCDGTLPVWGPVPRKEAKKFEEYFDEHFDGLLLNRSELHCIGDSNTDLGSFDREL